MVTVILLLGLTYLQVKDPWSYAGFFLFAMIFDLASLARRKP